MGVAVSEDVVRRAWRRVEESAGVAWLSGELRACVEPVLSQAWILDIDVTVKSIYGRQEGAELGHNPHKPGRPSHAYHSYFMANHAAVLGRGGARRQGACGQAALPGLWQLLEALPRTHWPTFLRGDCGYGNEVFLSQAEGRSLPYLCKLRHTKKVKALVQQSLRQGGQWQEAGGGGKCWRRLCGWMDGAGRGVSSWCGKHRRGPPWARKPDGGATISKSPCLAVRSGSTQRSLVGADRGAGDQPRSTSVSRGGDGGVVSRPGGCREHLR